MDGCPDAWLEWLPLFFSRKRKDGGKNHKHCKQSKTMAKSYKINFIRLRWWRAKKNAQHNRKPPNKSLSKSTMNEKQHSD